MSKKSESIGPAALQRLVRVHDYTQDLHLLEGRRNISSAELAKLCDCESSLVRRDLSAVGAVGAPRRGYAVAALLDCLRDALGMDERHRAVLFGAGRIGSSLLAQDWGELAGIDILAAFDTAPRLHGSLVNGIPVLSLDRAAAVIGDNHARLAILAVPADQAQVCADIAVAGGVCGIWNFAPLSLVLPNTVRLRQENLAAGLIELVHALPRA